MSDQRILVFAGTYEGHALAELFSARGWQEKADFCVATDYGTEVLSDIKGLSVIEGRLDRQEMERLLTAGSPEGAYGMVIDATHPYARVVTENLRAACEATGTEYVRLLREAARLDDVSDDSGIVTVGSAGEAASFLMDTEGMILLTTGSKELHCYRALADRVVARVLPSQESLRLCEEAGIPSKHIICMQGPFSRDMNLATIRQYGCAWLVTKNTGKPGGFQDKLSCLEEGCRILVIGRPAEETGLSLEEAAARAEAFYGA